MSDVALYLVRLADLCGVDLDAALERKMRVNEAKYPVALASGSALKYTAYVSPSELQQIEARVDAGLAGVAAQPGPGRPAPAGTNE